MRDTSVSPVRAEWLYETARVSQQILCEARAKGKGATEVVNALDVLPAPATPLERLVRQGMIFDVLLGCVDDRSCTHYERTFNVFRRVFESSARPSPLLDSPESRAAALIHERSTCPIDVAEIARTVGCEQTRLRRAFRDRFGISMRDFHTRCRIADAISLFVRGEMKTGSVARSVGYRSEKNFYRAFRGVTGKRPGELKSISESSLRQMARDILLGTGARG
jgi:AraC-like DNA-binding protein